jgi:hypothetical protein
MKLNKRLEHFLKYVDESTYWKEDNDVPNHVIVRAYLDKFKPNGQLSGIGSKRPTPQEFMEAKYKKAENRNIWREPDMTNVTLEKCYKYMDEYFKAACASGGEGKGVSDGLDKPKRYCKDGIRLCDCMGLICSNF